MKTMMSASVLFPLTFWLISLLLHIHSAKSLNNEDSVSNDEIKIMPQLSQDYHLILHHPYIVSDECFQQ
jgi:hypothetical protein